MIYAVIATKNRVNFLKKSLKSILLQTTKVDKIIVVSNSSVDNIKKEKLILKNIKDVIYIQNNNGINYASNLNKAIDWIIINNPNCNYEDIYIALLDDDDTWNIDYIKECKFQIGKGADIIAAGYKYIQNSGFELVIPPLNIKLEDFLCSNPGIQGSNTFIRMELLLKAGCFDENLNSTTDRDFFTRVLMLKNKYSRINKILVNINAKNNRVRLTNNKIEKKKSLISFYIKNNGFFNNEQLISNFLDRAKFLGIDLTKKDITQTIEQKAKLCEFEINNFVNNSNLNVIVGFIASNFNSYKNMIKQIKKMYSNYSLKIVVFANFEFDKKNINECNVITYNIYDIQKIYKENILENIFKKCINNRSKIDITIARTLLQFVLYDNSKDGDFIWIVDDDMELIDESDNAINLINIYKKYNKFDAIIGSYYNEPPTPLLSCLRTSLIDFVYTNKVKNKFHQNPKKLNHDYYYDLSNNNSKHLETPFYCETSNINDIFHRNVITRKCYRPILKEFEPYSRGGNTFVFNREILKIPTISVDFVDIQGRRGDYFWVLIARKLGYKILGINTAIKHNKGALKFDFEKELEKLKSDLIGSTITKAFDKLRNIDYFNFDFKNIKIITSKFFYFYNMRFSLIVRNLYRINGLLEILDDKKYMSYFSIKEIKKIIFDINNQINKFNVHISIYSLLNKLKILKNYTYIDKMKKWIENEIKRECFLLGIGHEGLIVHDKKYVYKIFFKRKKILKLSNFINSIPSNDFFYNIECFNAKYNYIKYLYHENEKYYGGYKNQIIDFIKFLISNNLTISNMKQENFVIDNKQIKFIDYGNGIKKINDEEYKKLIGRSYRMCCSQDHDWISQQRSIFLSYKNNFNDNNIRLKNWEKIIKDFNGESLIHDEIIKKILLKNKSKKSAFDYGAGKCELINYASLYFGECSAYDVNFDLMKNKANKKIKLYDVVPVNNKYDLILCNLVLCIVDDKMLREILNDLKNLSKSSSKMIISFCNPFFDDVISTEKTSVYNGEYSINNKYIKKTNFICRYEFHRSFDFYKNILEEYGFFIKKIFFDDEGVRYDNLDFCSERIILECNRKNNSIKHLIKNNIDRKWDSNVILVKEIQNNDNLTNLLTLFKFLKYQKNKKFILIIINEIDNHKIDDFINKYISNDSFLKKKTIYLKNKKELDNIINKKNNIFFIDSNDVFDNINSLNQIKNKHKSI